MSSSINQQSTQTPNNILALLSRYRVFIPGIQRHYVQGAKNPKAESIRKLFVKEIIDTIREDKILNLHFIYGPINTDGEDFFVPVDGQQRLTTLWLIARYAAEKCDYVTTREKILELLSRFSYEDRIHASRFCHTLTLLDTHWDTSKDPIVDILKQNWFIDYWKEDETVSSMIRMLSTIHKEWREEIAGEQVLNGLGSQISFELKIDSFGDDIYMKMNARGLQLTQWENFKCKFAETLGDYKSNWEEEIESLSNTFFTQSGTQELPDNSFFALVARIMVYEDKDNLQSMDSIKKLSVYTNETWNQIELPFVPYSDFDDIFKRSKDLSKVAESIVRLIKVALNNFCEIVPYFGERNLFDTLFHPANYNDLDFSLCCYEYFSHYNNDDDFIQATRLMWNILENVNRQDKNVYNRVSIVKRFIDLNNPSLYSENAIKVFKKEEAEQIFEEVEKSLKMNDDNQKKPNDWDEATLGEWKDWRSAIEYAEGLAFFHGSIRFLFHDKNGQTTWNEFASKLINCKKLFNKKGLDKSYKPLANRVLISHCNKWTNIKRIPVFDGKKESWKRILLTKELSLCVSHLLLNPQEVYNNDNKIINILINEDLWKHLIEDTDGYELEWKAESPSLWLKNYLSCTLKLKRNNREDILDEFSKDSEIIFEQKKDRYLTINGINYYYAVPVFFTYKHEDKEYRFAWQTWGWIDMYDDNNRLCDLYKSHGDKLCINIESLDMNNYKDKLNECINEYKKIILKMESVSVINNQ